MASGKQLSFKDLSVYRTEIMGVSAMGILLCHMAECQQKHGMTLTLAAKIFSRCTSFVDVFLILSGVGCFYSFSRRPAPWSFLKKRVERLLPAVLLIALPYWIWRDMIMQGQGIGNVLYDLTGLSFVIEGVKRFWFLYAIIVFYALFPTLYRFIFGGGRPAARVAAAVVFSAGGGVIIMWLFPQIYMNLKIMIDRVPALILGMFVGHLTMDDRPVGRGVVFSVLLLGLAAAGISCLDVMAGICSHILYYIDTVQAMLIILVLLVFFKRCSIGWIQNVAAKFGGVTLELYMFHSLLKNEFNYPGTLGKYVLLAVILPVICAFSWSKCCALIFRKGN